MTSLALSVGSPSPYVAIKNIHSFSDCIFFDFEVVTTSQATQTDTQIAFVVVIFQINNGRLQCGYSAKQHSTRTHIKAQRFRIFGYRARKIFGGARCNREKNFVRC